MVTTSILLDVIIIAVFLIFLIQGLSKGLIKMLSGLVAIVAGIFGGSYIAKLLSKPVANVFFHPWVSKTLNLAAQSEQVPNSAVVTANGELSEAAAGSLAGIVESSGLPRFSFQGTFENIGHHIKESGAELLNAAADIISERLAYIVLFIIAFIAIQILVHILFGLLNIVSKAPVLNTLNKWSGAVAGLLTAFLLVVVLMWFATLFIKPATEPGAILSTETIDKTYVAKYIDQIKNSFLN